MVGQLSVMFKDLYSIVSTERECGGNLLESIDISTRLKITLEIGMFQLSDNNIVHIHICEMKLNLCLKGSG